MRIGSRSRILALSCLLASGAVAAGSGTPGHGHGHTADIGRAGQSGELVWTFGKAAATLEFACNVPGHYAAGMRGPLHIKH